MLALEKQDVMPQHIVMCTGQQSLKNLVFRVYAFTARVYIDTFTRTKQNCKNGD